MLLSVKILSDASWVSVALSYYDSAEEMLYNRLAPSLCINHHV
jgi:hypothetical protein